MTVVNLNKARKAREREAAKTLAAANRTAFGRTRAEKAQAQAETTRAARQLDGKRLEPEGPACPSGSEGLSAPQLLPPGGAVGKAD